MNLNSILRIKLLSVVILFCSVFAVHAQTTPVEKHGQLKIFNGKVSDQAGNPVVLRGMSMFWSGYQEGAPYYTPATIQSLRDDWCVDVIRATMSVETGSSNYVNNESTEYAKIVTVVDACIAKGLYVIVDFHTHNAENYEAKAKKFFTDIATKYGNKPNILYETFNEPIYQSWSGVLKPYHNRMIQTIRAIDSDNIIICGTRTYSQEVDEAANDPVTGTNIAYTLHYYANSHQGSLRQKATNALNKGVALFVTEYGTCDASGNGGFNPGESQVWWNYLEANKLSSCNWSVVNKNETAAAFKPGTGISNWSDNDLTASGALVKAYIKGKCNVIVTTGSLTLSFNGNGVSYDAGATVTMTAAATVANGTISKVEFYDGATLLSTKTTSPYTFSTTTLSSGGHNITAKSYDAKGAEITVSALSVINIIGASNVSTTGITDQFEKVTPFTELTGGINGPSCATATAAAAAGIFWFEDRNAATPFKAEATRAGDGKLQYVVSQASGGYNVIGFNFGEYCQAGVKKKYTLDLRLNAVLNLTVSAPATNTQTLDLKFQMKDADGTVIAINKNVLVAGVVDAKNWYKYEIGFSKNHVTPDFLSLSPGSTANFTFDFKNALSVNNPNAPKFPADINTNNADFDWEHVTEVVIVPVNKADSGTPDFTPAAFTDQKILFSGLKLGDPALGVDICTTPNAVVTAPVTYCEGVKTATALTATGTAGLVSKWYTTETGGVANTTAPIPSTSASGVTSYYVSQAVSSTSTCEGPRTELKVTITAVPTISAGLDQAITGTTAALAGTGSAVGTWNVVSAPTGAAVTFAPSANAASVTANGLSVNGTYLIRYALAATSPCAAATDTVKIVKTTPTCPNPTVAIAGANQSITSATTATLSGTGTAIGTWSVQAAPTGAVVSLSPAGPSASVTANGLSADGKYTFKYSVTGVSPCVDATSTLDVVKTTPVCTTPPTANAGADQSITGATTASLSATGSGNGTWSLVSNPIGVTVTFSPSAGAPGVTANGLTADGTYEFKYTVKGISPCVDATSNVKVVKATPVCTTPPTASAGSNQSITGATTVTLIGTGTATGTWSVVTFPTGAAVGFSPSATGTTVTANGLTVNGTYTFKYTVTGTSPCAPATSTVDVVKSSPACTNPPAANAGTDQAITAATTAALTATGSAVGTWTLINGPSTVTFTPSAASASVTANGLTANGTYTFKYTVAGVSPCTDATSTVDVVKTAPTCTSPPTANAGSGQAITNELSISLTGTGSAVGTWSLVTGPSAVTFSPSANAASVTANGLIAIGRYTFQYTVKGTSPCSDATSTMEVVKSSPPNCTTPATANAGAGQAITNELSVSLTGTGSAVGTWSMVAGPSVVTFSPSANAASVTANGLVGLGRYTFQYTVKGVSPCADATSTVEIVKSSPPNCMNPTTANAGAGQSITTATSAALSGTGSTIGTWSLVSGPSAVTFSPSETAASLTVNGLTAPGTYTFMYTVQGTSPCPDATSTVEVVKSTTTGINDAYLKENITLYPNPVTDKLSIDMTRIDGTKSLRVVDVMGRVVYESQATELANVNMADLSKGMYFVHIDTESGTVIKAVIKQ